ncbi:MAG: MoxR family ATPase [Sedimenticola sp.]|nr:MoxR family ATPase [Sedimenticola sp.]
MSVTEREETGIATEVPAEIIDHLKGLEREIQKAVIGQTSVIREVIVGLLAAGHVLVEGVPGLGKTLLVRALAAAVGGRFSRVQFTPDLMPSDISGHVMFDMKRDAFRVRKGPVFCNFLLADEINRAPAKTQSALLEVMQEQQVTIEGNAYKLERPFLVLATQNPIEQEGTYPLPQAQLDRFLLKIFIDYPAQEEEQALVQHVTRGVGDQLDISAIKQLLNPEQIVQLQQYAASLRVDDQIVAYAVRIVRTARDWSGVEVGPGPRGSIALLRAGRAHALLSGNHFVTPDDIKAVTPSVLRHRMKLTTDLEIEGYKPDDVLADILINVEAPRI